ncbi:MAG: hypothetical protein V3U65_19125 [Granulosicoccaceae bacterium]
MLNRICIAVLLGLLSACVSNAPERPTPQQSTPTPSAATDAAISNAKITHEKLAEISGITAASSADIRFWAINDSGNDSILFAIGNDGKLLNQVSLPEHNRDWESLSRTRIGNKTVLIVGETGDNLRHHKQYQLHFVIEPTLKSEPVAPITAYHTMSYRFPDGSHNVEAMAATGNVIYLITKEPLCDGKATAGKLFRLHINDSQNDSEQMATYVGQMQLRPSSLTSSLAASLAGVDLNQATALTFAADKTAAYVLTYRHLVRFAKRAGQSWADALLGQGEVIHEHGLRQAEAMTIDNDGMLWLTSEKLPAPIMALPSYTQFE